MIKKLLRYIALALMMICATSVFCGCAIVSASASNIIKINEIMVKWKTSDNWIFAENNKFVDTIEEANTYKGWSETTITERNGNIISQVRQADNGSKTLTVDIFGEDGYINYYGRMDGSTFGWNWNCRQPNPVSGKGKIEDFFDDNFYLSVFESTIKAIGISPREENNVYYFEGVLNLAETVKNNNPQLSESFPDMWKHFKCTLSFGNSTAKEPPK